jgi:hypothetical protein
MTADDSVLMLNDPLIYGLDLQARGLLGAVARLIFGLALVSKVVAIQVRQPVGLSFVFARRISRTVRLLQALVAKYRAGTLKLPRKRRREEARTSAALAAAPEPQDAASADPAAAPVPPAVPPAALAWEKVPLPRSRGWLGRLVTRSGAVSGALIQLMAEPEFLAFLEATPQAGRLLRPLYWMVGMKLPPELAPPKRQRPAAAQAAESPRAGSAQAAGKQEKRPSYAERLRALGRGNISIHTRIPSADWDSSCRRRKPRKTD